MNDNDQSTSSEGGSESHSTHYVRNLGNFFHIYKINNK